MHSRHTRKQARAKVNDMANVRTHAHRRHANEQSHLKIRCRHTCIERRRHPKTHAVRRSKVHSVCLKRSLPRRAAPYAGIVDYVHSVWNIFLFLLVPDPLHRRTGSRVASPLGQVGVRLGSHTCLSRRIFTVGFGKHAGGAAAADWFVQSQAAPRVTPHIRAKLI